MSPVRLNDDTTGIRNVHAANWPARLAEKSVVWMTSGRHSRNSRRNRHTANGHVRPACRPDIPRADDRDAGPLESRLQLVARVEPHDALIEAVGDRLHLLDEALFGAAGRGERIDHVHHPHRASRALRATSSRQQRRVHPVLDGVERGFLGFDAREPVDLPRHDAELQQ